MIETVKLRNYKGIKELKLSGLGHINIISGKNNSGKSSVMECLVTSTKTHPTYSLGFNFNETRLEEMCASVLRRTNNNSLLQDHFRKSVSGNLGANYYFEDQQTFYSQFSHAINRGGHTLGTMEFQEFYNRWRTLIENSFKPLLIPAKRAEQSDQSSSTQTSLNANGQSLISHIFYLKNQLPGTELHKKYQEICKCFQRISDGLCFDVASSNVGVLSLNFSQDSNKWFKAASWGLGLQDLLTIISVVISSEANFIMIEEPENHIHPDMQRKLLQFLKSVENKQFLIASHSNVFLDSAYIDKMYLVEKKEFVELSDKTLKANILKDLGYSVVDNFVSDLIILTEGPTDVEVIEEICRKIGFWDKYNIKFWPLGGDVMRRIDLSALFESTPTDKIVALIDADPESKKSRDIFKEQCKANNIKCVQLKRYAIENYVPLDVIKKHHQIKVPVSVVKLESDKSMKSQLGFSIKRHLRALTKDMDIEILKDTDLYAFCADLQNYLK